MTQRWVAAVVAALALIGSLVLAGCGDDDDSDSGGNVYNDGRGRFSITLPEGWIQDRSQAASEVNLAFVDPQDDPSGGQPFRSNITIQITENVDAPLDAAARSYRESNLRELPLYDSNTDERVELEDGTEAQLLGGIFKPESIRLQILQLLVTAKGTGFVVQLTTPVASYPDREAALRDSLLSFEVS